MLTLDEIAARPELIARLPRDASRLLARRAELHAAIVEATRASTGTNLKRLAARLYSRFDSILLLGPLVQLRHRDRPAMLGQYARVAPGDRRPILDLARQLERRPELITAFGRAAPSWFPQPYEKPHSPAAVRWLHLSGIQADAGTEPHSLRARAMGKALEADLERLLEVAGPPHVVLIAGDLARTGKPPEYECLDDLLGELIGWLRVAGKPLPAVVAVPGNHDVARPAELWRFAFLQAYEDDSAASLRRSLWQGSERNADPIEPLFGGYLPWMERSMLPALQASDHVSLFQRSHFPGDLSVVVEGDGGVELGVVGLNSAWSQAADGAFRGKLHLDDEQLGAVVAGDHSSGEVLQAAPSLFEGGRPCVLLQHHPPGWLTERSRRWFDERIAADDRFVACLFGHQHDAPRSVSSRSGEERSVFYEVPPFPGGSHRGEMRAFSAPGFTLGEMTATGEIRLWPRVLAQKGDETPEFVADPRYSGLDSDGSVVVRKGARPDIDASAGDQVHQRVSVSGDELGASVLADLRAFALAEITEVELIGVGAGGPSFPLDEIYVPLGLSARPPRWLGGDVESGEPRHIAEAMGLQGQEITPEKAFAVAGRDHHLVLFGEPGSGKTTALRKLAHVVLTAGGQALGLPPDTIPLLLRLRQLRRGHLRHSLDTFIRRELHALSGPRFPRRLARQLWTRGRLLLLLDGLDEIADEALRAEVCAYLDQQLAGQHERGIRAAVSCRYAGYGGAVRLGSRFLHLDIRPLDDGQIAGLIHAWFRAARRALELDPARRDEAVRRARSEAADLVARLGRKEFASQRIKELVSTPLLLVLLCVQVMRGHVIPRRRVDFYARCLDVLLETKLRERAEDRLLERADTLDLLLSLAWRLHTARRRDDLTSEEFAAVASPVLERVRRGSGESPAPEALLDQLRRGAGVVTRYAQDRYGFMHLGLQEYLAAVHAARERSGALLVEMAQQVGEEWWREPILLAVGLSEYQAFVPLMEAVLARGDLAGHLDLVRECLDEAHAPDPAPFAAVVADDGAAPGHRAAVLRLYQDRGEPAIAEAVASAGLMEHEDLDLRALARQVCGKAGMEVPPETHADVAGDVAAAVPGPRTSERAVELLPGMRALWVPGGTFTLGGDPDALNARPAAEVAVPGFWLGEAPVTNDQYRVFLEETGHDEPPYWRKRRFNDPRQPVVTASWHDAVAFCAWLTQRQQTARTVELPTEVQWERAARGSDGRIYPWGAQSPDETRACFDLAWGEDRPAPVGSFPAGRGPYGHLDLAGLVWEWTRDDVSGEFGGRALRALRGGSWRDPAQFLRSASRDRAPTEDRFADVGFRVSSSLAN